MKQIYGFTNHTDMDLEETLRELRDRILALEIQVAELHRAPAEPT